MKSKYIEKIIIPSIPIIYYYYYYYYYYYILVYNYTVTIMLNWEFRSDGDVTGFIRFPPGLIL